MQGISTILVIILLVMIVVGIVGLSYSFFILILTSPMEAGEQTINKTVIGMLGMMRIVTISGNDIYVRNTGTIDLSGFEVFINEIKVDSTTTPDPLPKGESGVITLSETPSGEIKIYTVQGAMTTHTLPESGTCPDGVCNIGENCPQDASACTDNICYEPTCDNGCDEIAVPNEQMDEACNSTSGCASPPCQCDGSGNCISSGDTEPPTWSNLGKNVTNPNEGDSIKMYSQWNDNIQLSQYIFSWNASGGGCDTWWNDTAQSFQTNNWTNTSKTVPSGCTGKTIGFRFYANDTSGNNATTNIDTFNVQTIAAWFFSNQPYRRNITINNSINADDLTNYSIFINVTDSTNMQPDFDDLRFTYYNSTDDTETELDYWIEKKVDSNYAEVWIEVSSIQASGYETVYMYYGNDSIATTTSDGDNTFLFFDDFENDNLDKWSNPDNAWSTQSATVKYGTYAAKGLDSSSSTGGQLVNSSTDFNSYVLEEWVRFGETNLWHYPVFPAGTNGRSFYLVVAKQDGHWGYYNGIGYFNFPNDKTYVANTWYKVKFQFDAAQQKYWVWVDGVDLIGPSGLDLKGNDGTLLPTDGGLNLRKLVGSSTQIGADFWLDNYVIRKYADPEPTYSIGEEEIKP